MTIKPIFLKSAILLLFLAVGLLGSVHTYAQVINTYAGSGAIGHTGNGTSAITATLDSPTCVATDAAGNLYISDEQNNCIRKVDTFGIITTVAGTGTAGYNTDNIPATDALLSQNWGITVDATGNIYICDQSNYRVRKVNTAGIISTIAGNGGYASNGNGLPATNASFKNPIGIAVDGVGNVYVSDYYGNCVRRIDAAGIIHAFAGTGGPFGFGGDTGPAVNASFSQIFGLATDNAGNVYICDAGNNRVRKVNTSGIITTIAGNGDTAYGGNSGPAISAALNYPTAVSVSPDGVVYIADYHNNRIRRISASGLITTIAGTGAQGFFGDGGPAFSCKLSHPIGVTTDNTGNIFIADLDNVRIRKIGHVKDLRFTRGTPQSLTVCKDQGRVSIDSLLSIIDLSAGATDHWTLLSGPHHGAAVITYTAVATGGAYSPLGLSYTPGSGYLGNDTLVVRVSNGVVADTTNIIITVIPPVASAGIISGPSRLCVGSAITLTENIGGGLWGSKYAFATVAAGLVTGISPGIDTITYTVSNACSALEAKKPVTVDALPAAGSITGPTAVCVGNSILLSDPVTAGVWSVTNGNAAVGAGIVTGLANGMDTVIYTVSDSFCSAWAGYVITVDTFPRPAPITGVTGICVQTATTLTETTLHGIWSIQNDNASFELNDSTSVTVTGIAAGTDNVSYSIVNTCGTGFAMITITINPLPGKPVITEYRDVLSANPGYTSYQWATGGSNIPGAVSDTFLALALGNYVVTVHNQYGCAASSDSVYDKGCDAGDIVIYPDPAIYLLHIQWCKPVTARLMCMDGKNIKTVRGVNEIELGDLPNGMYMLSVFDENNHKLISKKIVKISK